MLLFIKGRLQILQEQLAAGIFSVMWKNLAQALNKFIYEEVRVVTSTAHLQQHTNSEDHNSNNICIFTVVNHGTCIRKQMVACLMILSISIFQVSSVFCCS